MLSHQHNFRTCAWSTVEPCWEALRGVHKSKSSSHQQQCIVTSMIMVRRVQGLLQRSLQTYYHAVIPLKVWIQQTQAVVPEWQMRRHNKYKKCTCTASGFKMDCTWGQSDRNCTCKIISAVSKTSWFDLSQPEQNWEMTESKGRRDFRSNNKSVNKKKIQAQTLENIGRT